MFSKNNFLMLVGVFLFLFFGFKNLSQAQNTKPKIVLLADPWCPHTCDPSQGKLGILIDMAKLILERSGYEVEYKILNWSRSIDEVRKGRADVLAGAFVSDAEDFVFPSRHQFSTQNCFYSLESKKFAYKDSDSLKAKRVGIVQGYSYPPLDELIVLPEAKTGIKFEAVSGTEGLLANWKKLIAGRLDVVLEDSSVFRYFQSQQLEAKKADSMGCLEEQNTYLAFSPHPSRVDQSKQLAKLVSDAMTDKKFQKEFKRIYSDYGITYR